MHRLWIDDKYCKGCMICIDVCPTKAIRPSEKLNQKGYRLPREENMALCKGCGSCVLMCPDFAIAIEEVD